VVFSDFAAYPVLLFEYLGEFLEGLIQKHTFLVGVHGNKKNENNELSANLLAFILHESDTRLIHICFGITC